MSSTITESGMHFAADNAFHIEKSRLYTNLGSNVKSVEFIRAKDDKLLFIEAKLSFPNPDNPASIERFKEEVDSICDKFIHSLNLYSAIDIGVTEDSFPPNYQPPNKVTLTFILVINNFSKTWCYNIKKAIANRLRESVCMAKIWKPEIYVINDQAAAHFNLTVS